MKQSFCRNCIIVYSMLVLLSSHPFAINAEAEETEKDNNNKVMYCTAQNGLYIREESCISGPVVGGYEYGDPVYIFVPKKDNDISADWYTVAYHGSDYFVFSAYLSEDRPADAPNFQTEDNETELINSKGDLTTAYQLTDGTYMDRINRTFVFDDLETWYCTDGSIWNKTVQATTEEYADATSDYPEAAASFSASSVQETEASTNTDQDVVILVNAKGDTTTVYRLADGSYMDRIERIFTYDGTDTWYCADGTEWNRIAD